MINSFREENGKIHVNFIAVHLVSFHSKLLFSGLMISLLSHNEGCDKNYDLCQ